MTSVKALVFVAVVFTNAALVGTGLAVGDVAVVAADAAFADVRKRAAARSGQN